MVFLGRITPAPCSLGIIEVGGHNIALEGTVMPRTANNVGLPPGPVGNMGLKSETPPRTDKARRPWPVGHPVGWVAPAAHSHGAPLAEPRNEARGCPALDGPNGPARHRHDDRRGRNPSLQNSATSDVTDGANVGGGAMALSGSLRESVIAIPIHFRSFGPSQARLHNHRQALPCLWLVPDGA
jgi:hypothetical protein